MAIQVGDAIAFKGKGPIFLFLSFLISIFVPEWRGRKWKPWHLAIASKRVGNGWMIIEAVAGGVQEKFHSMLSLKQNTANYHWLDKEPSQYKMAQLKELYLGYPYDVKAYFSVLLTFFFWKITGKSFRIVDTDHMCWESLAACFRFLGKPIQPICEYPVIWRMIKKLEIEHNGRITRGFGR